MQPLPKVILLVEDDDLVRDVMQRALLRAGYRVLPASSAREAVAIGEHHREAIDGLVTDLDLGDASGSRLAAEIEGLRPGIKVLFVSGSVEPPEGIRHPMIAKPFASRALLDRIARIFSGR